MFARNLNPPFPHAEVESKHGERRHRYLEVLRDWSAVFMGVNMSLFGLYLVTFSSFNQTGLGSLDPVNLSGSLHLLVFNSCLSFFFFYWGLSPGNGRTG